MSDRTAHDDVVPFTPGRDNDHQAKSPTVIVLRGRGARCSLDRNAVPPSPRVLMSSPVISNMLAALQRQVGDRERAETLAGFGLALVDAPAEAAALLSQMAGSDATGPRADDMIALLSTALDEARMARENGRRRGDSLIGALEAQVESLVSAERLTMPGAFALSRAWVRAGLVPPDRLSIPLARTADPVSTSAPGIAGDADAMFESLFESVIEDCDGNISALHAVFAEMLPAIPVEARAAFVRIAVARPPELFAELGCAWLFDPGADVRLAAVAGLSDRLEAGTLSATVLARLVLQRSWMADSDVEALLDGLLRQAMRQGVSATAAKVEPKIHRVVASMIDGSGAQSIAVAIQAGGARSVAVVLLKQGFGVKDAYVLPCSSATEQRNLIASITDQVEAFDVSKAYLDEALGVALGEGLESGLAPVPGLVDVAQGCGLHDLRPRGAGTGDILALADPESRVAQLSAQARGRLIGASGDWGYEFPMLSSWFEDDDATVAALDAAPTQAARTKTMWQVLEARRRHWERIIARNGHMLSAAGSAHAESFVAVAAALAEGRPLKKVAVMQLVHDLSLEVWADEQAAGMENDAPMPSFPEDGLAAEIPPEIKGEVATLLRPAGLSEPWLDGYITAVCTAPIAIDPSDWLGPLVHLVGERLTSDMALKRCVELFMLRYNAKIAAFRASDRTGMISAEPVLLSVWADGYLTSWEATKPCWPARLLGKDGKAMRRLFEAAADDGGDLAVFSQALPAWLEQRFANQRM